MTSTRETTLRAAVVAAFGLFLAVTAITGQESEPTQLPTGAVGPAALDLNLVTGDQGQRQTFRVPTLGEFYTVDIVATEGLTDRIGYQVTLSYDPDALTFVDATTTGLFREATPITLRSDTLVTIAGVSLEGAARGSAGSIVQARFNVVGGFTGETRVTLESMYVGTPFEVDTLAVGDGARYVVLGGTIPQVAERTADLDGDSLVGFSDFVIFAQSFGLASSDQSYNPRHDLDDDGQIGFTDFILFAQSFGSTV